MASKSDGKEEDLISFSSMRQPPLIKQLKGILSEYPDGGQILKELIQNAEDADATVVQVEYDTRRINDQRNKDTPIYTKFFKGPALCVYNDAVFTNKDWEGIRMIYSSVKEDDRLKVGRFGLGFKSIFHITDHPCVLSGDQCLMIDPQQPQDRVNAMFKLSTIDKLENTGLPAAVFWSALNNKFGLTPDCIKKGYFKGTIFWFPLREKPSKLSETLYDSQKVYDLFDDFKSDSSSILVFLKSLEKIQLYVVGDEPSRELISSVEILDDNGQVKKLRRKFKGDLKKITKDYKGDDFTNQIQMTIRTEINQTPTDTLWSIVNYFVASSASHEFKKLINDDSLEYSPYVGVACPISQTDVSEHEGHVFCFLPLPREGSKLTGLPVHVNGFFALSQSRHHIKFETDGQSGKKIDDKSILWNRCLIKEAIPKAYCKLILNMIDYSIHSGNTSISVRNVYDCWPRKDKTADRWRVLECEVYSKLKTEKVFYTAYKNAWIALSDTCFATFSSLSEKFMYVSEAVKHCMNQVGMNYAEVPIDILETMKQHYKKVKNIKPDLLVKSMHRCDAYKTMEDKDKKDVLLYLLLDKNCYDKLKGLALLPLASGHWTTLDNKHEPVYVCEDEVHDILPGLEFRLLMKKNIIGLVVFEKMSNLCGKGFCQLKRLGEVDLVKLIEACLDIHFRESGKHFITSSTKLTTKWLQSLWSYLIRHKNLAAFQNVQILPKLSSGNWDAPQHVELVKLSDIVLVKTVPKAKISSSIVRCFETMGVTVIDALPTWIPTDHVKQFLFLPTLKGIVSLLEHVFLKTKWQNTIEVFNQTCREDDRKALVTYLTQCTHLMTEDVIKMLNKLQIVEAITHIEEKGRYVTIAETKEYILDTVKFPQEFTLPFTCCRSTSEMETLMSKIGGRNVDLHELILAKLKLFLQNKDNNEIPKFMQYIITNFSLFEMNEEIIQLASQIPFLRVGKKRHTPEELFDPSDENIAKMLYKEDLLPETKKRLNKEAVRALKVLGLRTSEDIDADLVLQIAESLDKWSKHCQSGEEYIEKSRALWKFLKQRPLILDKICLWDQTLSNRVSSLECIVIDQEHAQYPSCLARYELEHKLCKPTDVKEMKLSLLVGASMATISSDSDELISAFGWLDQPDLKTILFQLQTIIKCYSVQVRPDLMQSINMIYSHLSLRVKEIRLSTDLNGDEKLVWTGDGFQRSNKVIINRKQSDLDLSPYFYFLPEEFVKYEELFETLGCRKMQNHEVLIDALCQIKELHERNTPENHITRRDQHLVCNILDQIASFIDDGEDINVDDIPVMVHSDNKHNLDMFPVSECVYDDDPDYFYEDIGEMHLVHEMISQETVNSLGIRSITRKVLMDAEDLGIEIWEQKEHLTTRINTLLRDGYADGLSVPKELIQNADDAGAKTVKFLFDERQNHDSRKRVLSRAMASFQGPALWVFNDAQFSDEDLKNITKFNGATKLEDCKTIGKFGLGFCSVYNLTDIPSFVTGNNLVFFDPHETHLAGVLSSKKAGLKYTLPNRTLVARHADQFKPYNGVFDCDIMDDAFESYGGSLFRLPLRTEQQARESKISSRSYTNEEMKSLLHMFIKNAGNMLLFSQNVCSVEFHHLSENSLSPKDAKLICKVDKESYILEHGRLSYVQRPVLHRASDILANGDQFSEIHKSSIRQNIPDIDHELFLGLDISNLTTCNETSWLTSWAIGSKTSLNLFRKNSSYGTIPLASVAVPCEPGLSTTAHKLVDVPTGFYNSGHLFCFLPMPIQTKLSMHINGCFAISSDRRRLLTKSEDDKLAPTYTWNECLLNDALVTAHIHLLEVMTKGDTKDRINIYNDLWPACCEPFLDIFKSAFYKRIVSDNAVVFKSLRTWESFQDICFLDFSIRTSHIGEIAFIFLSTFHPRHTERLVDLPEDIFINIRDCNTDKRALVDSKTINKNELLLLFLEHINDSFWDGLEDERNALIVETLRSCDKKITDTIKTVECVPTEPNQRLRKPSDLIHPNASVTKLFTTEDEVFPSRAAGFQSEDLLQKLLYLGMCENSLPINVLVNRCEKVKELAEKCCQCALHRSGNILQYLSSYRIRTEIKNQIGAQKQLSDICMLPILEKPKDWIFSWETETASNKNIYKAKSSCCDNHRSFEGLSVLFSKPRHLFRQSTIDFVGTKQLILNESLFDRRYDEAYRFLSVNDMEHVTSDMIASQLLTISKEYNRESQFDEFSKLHSKLLATLNDRLQNTGEDDNALDSLKILCGQPIVLIGKDLVKPEKVAENLEQECRPFLYKLPDHYYKRKKLFYSLGVKEHFKVLDIIEIMDEVITNDKSNIDLLKNLLINLENVLSVSGMMYNDIQNYHDRIIAHDTEGNLWPTYELVTENDSFQTDLPMNTLHPTIAPALGERLGVKAKQRRCYTNIARGVSFGQREKLVTRIQGLLKSYPCDSSILKELLQNADDSGATEIHFIKDYRSLSCKTLFSENCEPLQGPSLCVFNNSYFTESDIEGIHNLGKGSKSNDPSRTGQYGVGFNAVYHLTDTPSFVTVGPGVAKDGLFFIFDPLCKHVPEATLLEPGMMSPVEMVKNNFPDHLLGFSLDKLLIDKVGTVFRFPLRKTASAISENTVTISAMDQIIESFREDMLECLLFLKNIRRITVSNISENTFVEDFTVEMKIHEEHFQKKIQFIESMQKQLKQHADTAESILCIDPIEIVYPVEVFDSNNLSQSWVIVQRFGIGDIESEDSQFNSVKSSFKSGDLKYSPTGGVAIPTLFHRKTTYADQFQPQTVDNIKRKLSGRAFCFLPLPVQTGLPIHVNGHFALDHESRRDLWTDGFRLEWNKCIIKNIVIPAWMSGMEFIKNMMNPVVENSNTWHDVNQEMDAYHKLFPIIGDTTSAFWKYVACSFYSYVYNNEVEFFPSILKQQPSQDPASESTKKFDVSWECIGDQTKSSFNGVFNCIPYTFQSKDILVKMKSCSLLEKLLKRLGLKLLQAPLVIGKSVQASGITSHRYSSPDLVMDFLRTYSDHYGKACHLGQINADIASTKFETIENLKLLLQYISIDGNFCEKVSGLPVILTADGYVRKCCDERPVFISEYASLLSGSLELFVHDSILDIFTPNDLALFDTDAFRCFTFDDFLELLPTTLSRERFASKGNIALPKKDVDDDVLTMKWLENFYDFLCKESMKKEGSTSSVNSDMLLQKLKALDDWSLLPVTNAAGDHVLFPFSKMNYILHVRSLSTDWENKVIQNFLIPRLYIGALRNCRELSSLLKHLPKFVASLDQPYRLLKCFVHHKDILISQLSKCSEGNELLEFFDRSMDVLKKEYSSDEELAEDLRQLPLYSTLQGKLTTLKKKKNTYVLPRVIPRDGIEEWADSCNVILLQESYTLKTIYNFLGLQKADADSFYAESILPNIHALPQKHILAHVTFLRSSMSTKKPVHKKIIQHLSNIAFIEVNGVMRRANDLYDPDNKVFKLMCGTMQFPPDHFLDSDWKPFLHDLGLISEVNDQMLIEFARKIERQNAHSDSKACRQSKTLLRCFIKKYNTWKNATIHEMKSIRFIVPFMATDECTNVYPQLNNGNQLICCKGSVSSKPSLLCWSSSNIISEETFSKISSSIKTELGMLDRPSLESVILHCQNICPSLKAKFADLDKKYIERQMTAFYDFLQEHTKSDLSLIKTLDFVHLPEDNVLVSAADIVIDINQDNEIKPYIYRAPTYYGKYYQLFEALGSKKNMRFCHYARIITNIHAKTEDRQLNPTERYFVRRAMCGLLQTDVSKDETVQEIQHLYLPDEKMVLKDSTMLVVSNNYQIERRLRGKVNIEIMASESFLNVSSLSFDVIKTWPTHLKSRFLTDIVEEQFCSVEDNNADYSDSNEVQILQRFLLSKELLMGICRLLKHQHLLLNKQFDREYHEKEVSQRLKAVEVVHLPSLRTKLKYNGNLIDGTEANILFHIEYGEPNIVRKFYFVNVYDAMRNLKIDILPGLTKVLQSCALMKLNASSMLSLPLIVNQIGSPQQIQDILDSLDIKSYDCSNVNEYFPAPGTYVERQFIPFLEQGILPFEEYEYSNVAMELEDIPFDQECIDTLFIYVKILREVPEKKTRHTNISGNLRKMYWVETGNKDVYQEKIPIYRLYRFVRRQLEPGALRPMNVSTEDTVPFDRHCVILKNELIEAWRLPESERKRIFRRMLLKWHPDKNLDNEEYSRKMFQYLKIIYSRLENGEIIVESVEEEMFRGPSHSSQTTEDFFDDINRRATKQARAFKDNVEEYSKSTRTGLFSHIESTSMQTKQGDVKEAIRWMRQAKSDFNAAKAFLSCAADVQAYNWICKMCHQACETALKAACLYNDRSAMLGRLTNLRRLAPTREIGQQASVFDDRFGDSARFTTPDTASRPNIPSTLFELEDAEYALTTTKEILEIVDDFISD